MRSAFDKENISKEIKVNIKGQDDNWINFEFTNDNMPDSKWRHKRNGKIVDIFEHLAKYAEENLYGRAN